MYAASDPRASLADAKTNKKSVASAYGSPTIATFYTQAPQSESDLHRFWLARGQNFLALYGEVKSGYSFVRTAQPDEFALVLPQADTSATVTWNGETNVVNGPSITFIPAGDSQIEFTSDCVFSGFFTTKADDLVTLCSNVEGYEEDPNVPAIVPWPDPDGGFKIRSYKVDFPIEPGRFGRIFRCTTLMVNFLDPRHGPRDPSTLSPHEHADFQQCSLVLDGTYFHHMRRPWLSDKRLWSDDLHEEVGAPSVTFIPAQIIHTSEAAGDGRNHLVDVFCPPRHDFSDKEGWVMNAADYPAPPKN
ncbi:MAG: hypothetical protein ACU0CA_11075 [Paracoccaceae bacterium]